jgi:hypothetical protein
MSKVTYVDLIPTIELGYYSNLKIADRFTVPHVVMKKTFFSRKSIKGLTAKSLLPQISIAWATLSPAEHTAWTNAGAVRGLNGWRLFVADMCARIKNGIAGIAIPSLLHQSWVGKIKISAPADEIKIAQLHPSFYWINRKVYGKKGMYEPVKISEHISLPLVLSLNYKSNLILNNAKPAIYGDKLYGDVMYGDEQGFFDAVAKFYADVWYSYQGKNLIKTLEIPFDLVSDWKNAIATLTTLPSIIIGYTLYIHLYKMTGELYIDNVKATHTGQNWVRDTYCDDIYQTFSRAFYQIPDHWAPVTLPSGAEYDSVYEDF